MLVFPLLMSDMLLGECQATVAIAEPITAGIHARVAARPSSYSSGLDVD